ncbi:PadR family transcriptional regulator [Gemmatimonas sp.]|jgi:PadR family transcriptional regulator PadR|uniref:PadR family transcriptional regulator n=1 Tax=Gemmatimonas sp. TaxID=1962908 RepID=UPI0037BF1E17
MNSQVPMKTNWLYILLSLAAGPRHGSAIQDDARTLSDGAVRLWPATLYGSLEELLRLGWIEELQEHERPVGNSGRERFYRLTTGGRQTLEAECVRLEAVARKARARLSGLEVRA